MIDKKMYFDMLTTKSRWEHELNKMRKHWNNTLAWEGTEDEIRNHYRQQENLMSMVRDLTMNMRDARLSISKMVLDEWAKEYRGR